MILEFRDKKEINFKEKTYQVCDEICHQLFKLQQTFKSGDYSETLIFLENYFAQEEEEEF